MRDHDVLFKGYAARIEGVLALRSSIDHRARTTVALRKAATAMEHATLLYGNAVIAKQYAGFADLLGIAAQLVDWRAAVLDAESDADRHRRAAKAKTRLWLDEYGTSPECQPFVDVARMIDEFDQCTDVGRFCNDLAAIPLPIGYYAKPISRLSLGHREQDEETVAPPDLEVAFLRFRIDNEPATEVHYLEPEVVHDLDVEVRISRWPDSADTLRLEPITIEPGSSYELPVFLFARPEQGVSLTLHQRGRALLKYSQHIGARPYEFKYTASFLPSSTEQPVAVVGHRTLRLEGIDVAKSPVTGYRHIDRRLLVVRDQLRAQYRHDQSELTDLMTLVTPLCALAGRALQDALFRDATSEAIFQALIRDELRHVPAIGAQLEEHPRAGGGITDLSFKGIPLELKYEGQRHLVLSDCETYLGQTLSYTVANGKRVGVLCVLDNSPKVQAPFPAEDGIGLFTITTSETPVYVVVVLLQGNLSRPSALSRPPHGKRVIPLDDQ